MYTAVIIEPRKHPALFFVVKNVLTTLECKVIICHGNRNKEFVDTIVKELPFKNLISTMHIHVDNFTQFEYSEFLKTNKSFYHAIPTETFLIFQTDSILFEKNKNLLNLFLKYDYVGAPWKDNVGNGGLSLRKKSKMLEIIEKEPYNSLPEDVFFAMNKSVPLLKPSVAKAKHFAVENIYEAVTFGSHQPWKQKNTNFYTLYPELVEFEKLNL